MTELLLQDAFCQYFCNESGFMTMAIQIEGLWTAEIGSLGGWSNGGIVIFVQGKMFGGGDQHYCVGHYDLRSHVVSGEARSLHFHGPAQTAFGDTTPDFRFAFRGRWIRDSIDGHMYRTNLPGLTLPFQLIWRSSLIGATT